MIADVIRLSALYVLARVLVEIAFPSAKLVVKYVFWTGVILTVLASIGPTITRMTDDLHNVATTYTQGREVVNNITGGPTNLSVGYQSMFEKLLGNAKFDWPTKGKITQEFIEGKHHGIDLAGNVGDKIKASRPGKVKQIGEHDIYGLCITLDQGNGWETLYAHCSEVLVKEGENILNGQVIAKVGNSGKSSGPHLHFEIRQNNGTCVDPTKYLK